MTFLSPPPASSLFYLPCLLYLGDVVTPEGFRQGRMGQAPNQSPRFLGKPAFPISSPEKDCVPPALEEIHPQFLASSTSTRKILFTGIKNRTLELDFYGLVKSTVLMPTHTWSLPLPGPIQLPSSSSAQTLQALQRGSVDLRVEPWPRPSPYGSQPQSSCSPTSRAPTAGTCCVSFSDSISTC